MNHDLINDIIMVLGFKNMHYQLLVRQMTHLGCLHQYHQASGDDLGSEATIFQHDIDHQTSNIFDLCPNK